MEQSDNQILCMGIDETNHGISPEFYVLTYSLNVDYIIKRSVLNKLSKPRINGKQLDDILEEDIGFFVHKITSQEKKIMRKEYGQKEGYHEHILATESTLISSALKEVEHSDIVIRIDGKKTQRNMVKNLRERLFTLGHEIDTKTLKFEKEADRRYELVNKADLIAYFFRNHGSVYNEMLKKGDSRIVPMLDRAFITPASYNALFRNLQS